jgi:catechol 2,3-dioxygenase-like lactoylglutathione lyase family enzyme
VRVTRALHCNLNVRDLAAAAAVYQAGLGLRTRMRSRAEGTDSTPLGIDGPTDSEVWFLYDHRGGRIGPAVELARWEVPATAGETYPDPSAVGMQALGFAVSSLTEAADRLVAAGAQRVARGSSAIDALLLDADDVAIELVTNSAATDPTLVHVRLNCVDLERTTAWYEAIGLQRVDGVETESWRGSDLGNDAVDAPVQRLTFGDASGFELRLTTWPGTDALGRAHDAANHRGLFRMALAVDDVRATVADAATDERLTVSEPVYIPLPDTPLGGLWVAFLRDPDGVTVEFVERPAASS